MFKSQLQESGGSVPIIKAKLLKIKIAKFSCVPKAWQSFWDSFSAAVHSNTAIHDVDKFNYLKGLLESPALSAITGLTLTDSNYEVAVDLLKQRFGNKQLVISAHMEALLQLPTALSITDIKRIRVIYDKIEANVTGLEAVGITAETWKFNSPNYAQSGQAYRRTFSARGAEAFAPIAPSFCLRA